MTESSAKEKVPTNESKLQCGDYQPLVPLRVDVSVAGTNKASPATPSLRVVETILLDPWIWPLRPRKPNDEELWIEDNARLLAHNILTDLEVQGMGRTVRHFTNRAEIWSVDLQKRVMDQLRPQLQVVAGMRQKMQQQQKQQHFTNKKRSSAVAAMVHSHPGKKRKTSDADADASMNDADDSNKKEDIKKEAENENATDNKIADTATSSSTNASQNQSTTGKQDNLDQKRTPGENATAPLPLEHLIPIKIRLSVHGVRIHDDCLWDPSLSSLVTPLDYARILAHDLKLSPEAVQAIAVDITEQIYGSARNGDVPEQVEVVDEDSPVKASNSTTAAWGLDSRTHISHVAHLVAQHRQP